MNDEQREEATPEEVRPVETGPAEAEAPQGVESRPLTLGDTSELAAIEESLTEDEAGEPAAAETVAATPGEEALFLSEPDSSAVPEPPATETIVEPAAAPAQTIGEEPLPDVYLGPDRRSNLWVWVGLAVGVLIAVAAIGYVWWYATSRPIIVPDVVGKLPAQATQSLNDAGLRLGKVSEQPTDTAPAGTVISQSPEALEELKPGTSVSIVLASAPTTAKVPEIGGRAFEEASSLLVENRLNPLRIESYSTTVAAGFVMSQLPAAGASVPPGGTVAVVVSRGQAPTSFRVPQLTGLPAEDAASLLAPLDVVAASYRSVNSSVPAGTVVTQTPLPGTQVLAGGGIQYLVSVGVGAAPVTVPDVVGESRKDAENAIKAKGLKAQVREVPSATVPKGAVISQMPPANGRSASGGTVGLLVSKGNVTQGAVPALVGKSSDEASKAVGAAGFRPVIVEIPTADQAAGKVFMQFPLSKTTWSLRLPVVCLVAKAP